MHVFKIRNVDLTLSVAFKFQQFSFHQLVSFDWSCWCVCVYICGYDFIAKAKCKYLRYKM
jgi:hypothetical protein